jgi:AmmeMemoRadiSam system protein A
VILSDEERAGLLEIARAAVAVASGARAANVLWAALDRYPALGVRTGSAFVTLTEDGELRGCMGHLDLEAPLAASVVEAATWAVRADPRFTSVTGRELPRIHVDVSVLGPFVRLADPTAFRPGTDGIVVEHHGRRALLLPEVATMLGLDREGMLEAACRKAGMTGRAWRDPATGVLAFRTSRFGGPALAVDA